MILGTGCDITEISRIEHALRRFGDHFLDRILAQQEKDAIHGPLPAFLAGRFAAKEACAKAFGLGFQQGLTMPQIVVTNNALGSPELFFLGRARRLAEERGIKVTHLSISHEQRFAIAFVVFEGSPLS